MKLAKALGISLVLLSACSGAGKSVQKPVGSGDQNPLPQSLPNPSATPILQTSDNFVFPVTNFHAKGLVTITASVLGTSGAYNSGLTFDLRFELMQTMLRVTAGNIAYDAPLTPDRKAKADAKVAKATGQYIYTLASADEAEAAYKAKNTEVLKFVVYAKSLTKPDGSSFTFSPPLPVLVLPSSQSTYEEAFNKKDNGYSFVTQVSGSASMQLRTTLSRETTGADRYKITKRISIDNANNTCAAYEQIAEGKVRTYAIDTVNLRIMESIGETRFFAEEAADRCGTVATTLKLCNVEANGDQPAVPFSCL